MRRDLFSLKGASFDIAVVGAGIHGATAALEAAKAGYSVLLLDKKDFGHSTSANSLKIVHGGIRYLQHGDVKRMRESITSRRSMMQFAPHLVKPLACLMPTYGHGIKGREMMRLAFGVYDLVAFDKNAGLPEENHLPQGHSIDTTEVRWAIPGIAEENLTGGAVWYDAIADDTERLILEYVKEAVRYGATALNYAEAVELKTEGGQVTGLVIRDAIEDFQVEIGCCQVVNSAGPWLAGLAGNNGDLSRQQWASAVNIVVKKRLFHKYAVGLEGYTDYKDKDAIIKRGKRLFFFVPWQDKYTMIGTNYKPFNGRADELTLSRDELQDFVDDINKVYPAGELTLDDVTFFHAGLLPMDEADTSQKDSVQLNKSSEIIDHGQVDKLEGIISIKGVKYTTAPSIAKDLVALLDGKIGEKGREFGSYVAGKPSNLDYSSTIEKLGREEYQGIVDHLKARYGKDWREVFKYLVTDSNDTEGASWLSLDPPLLMAEVKFFIRDEMAVTLLDVIIRRSNIGSAEQPESGLMEKIIDTMVAELHWSDEEKKLQLQEVAEFYAPFTG